MIAALEALQRLRDGNRRFVDNMRSDDEHGIRVQRADMAVDQEPFAIVVGCSDSRVPAEIVFDQGLGDLYVIRVAGNVVAPSQVASVEFAAEQFHTRLVVVMGHTRCGAIAATLEAIRNPADDTRARNLRSIVSRVRPAVESALRGAPVDDEALSHAAVRANVCAAADHLRHGSAVLEELVLESGLLIVGAEYSLETGEVEFFDGVPAGA